MNGADPNIEYETDLDYRKVSEARLTTLRFVVEKGNIQMTKLLLAHKANPNLKSDDGSPLHVATKLGHHEIVLDLLKNGAKVNLKTKKGESALHLASENGYVETVIELIKNGANVNAEDINGLTPLHKAVEKEDLKIVTELLNLKQVIPNIESYELGEIPLHIATKAGNFEICRKLLAAGADVNHQNNKWETALHLATELGHVDIVKELLNYGANINAHDKNGCIPLHSASKKGNVKIVEQLLKHESALPNLTTPLGGDTALHYASNYGHFEVVSALIRHGANVNQQDGNNETALHFATKKGYIFIVNELLKNNANPYLKSSWCDETDKSAIELANDHEDPVIKSELLNCFANITSLNLALKDSQFEFVKV